MVNPAVVSKLSCGGHVVVDVDVFYHSVGKCRLVASVGEGARA